MIILTTNYNHDFIINKIKPSILYFLGSTLMGASMTHGNTFFRCTWTYNIMKNYTFCNMLSESLLLNSLKSLCGIWLGRVEFLYYTCTTDQ